MVRSAARALASSSTTRMRALAIRPPEASGVPHPLHRRAPLAVRKSCTSPGRTRRTCAGRGAFAPDSTRCTMSGSGWVMETRNVYLFGGGGADGGREQRNLLGGKGANLAEMARLEQVDV